MNDPSLVCMFCIGNHMDESAIWEKIAQHQENCTMLYELL